MVGFEDQSMIEIVQLLQPTLPWQVGKGEWERFQELSAAIDAFARRTFVAPMDGYVQRMLWALQADGVLPRNAHDPWAPTLAPANRESVAAAVRALRGC